MSAGRCIDLGTFTRDLEIEATPGECPHCQGAFIGLDPSNEGLTSGRSDFVCESCGVTTEVLVTLDCKVSFSPDDDEGGES